MDTIWFEDFLAVLQEGGFSRATNRRGITQPAFSRRIRAPEDWVGAPLFEHGIHRVQLTPAGQRFRALAEDILRRLEVGREDVLAAAQAEAETLCFASTHVLSLTFFPRWLRDLEAKAPSTAAVQLTADTMVACERLMAEGRVQFLLCHTHPSARTRLTADAFLSVGLGHDILVRSRRRRLRHARWRPSGLRSRVGHGAHSDGGLGRRRAERAGTPRLRVPPRQCAGRCRDSRPP